MTKKKRVSGSPEAQLEDLKRYIKKVLNEAGMYRAEMTYQVELTASTMQIFRRIRDEILVNEEPPIIEEKSREGDKRKKENPIHTMYRNFADLLRRDLRSLNMNKELTKGKDEEKPINEDSPLVKLMRDLDEEEEE